MIAILHRVQETLKEHEHAGREIRYVAHTHGTARNKPDTISANEP